MRHYKEKKKLQIGKFSLSRFSKFLLEVSKFNFIFGDHCMLSQTDILTHKVFALHVLDKRHEIKVHKSFNQPSKGMSSLDPSGLISSV